MTKDPLDIGWAEGGGARAKGKSTDKAGNAGQKIYSPVAGSPSYSTNMGENGGAFGAGRDGGARLHAGLDISASCGTACVAPVDGTITMDGKAEWASGGMIHFKFGEDCGSIKKGEVIGWGHVASSNVTQGQQVKGGEILGKSGGPPTYACHVHFVYRPSGEGAADGEADPAPVYEALKKGAAPTGTAGESGGGGGGGAGGGSLAKAAAFATFLHLSTVEEMALSKTLTGEKSLMNDKPLFPFIQQLTEASLRSFQSMPNGNFFAFYPDYFGGMGHRKPYWKIRDIEIIDGNIDLSDDALATHVFIVGSTLGNSQQSIGASEMRSSSGVVTIFNAFMLNFLDGNFSPSTGQNPYDDTPPSKKTQKKEAKSQEKWMEETPTLANKDNAIAFLKKYGARPHYEEMPMIRSPYYELFLAYQRFCLLWAQQFSTTFQLTFMPELFPGGLIELEDHGVQCYVESVSHNCSYSQGFTTEVVLSSPASSRLDQSKPDPLKVGLVRAGIFGPDGPRVDPEPKVPTKGNRGESR